MDEYQNIKIKYFLYARKSTESEDRQIQSIDDQIRWMQRLAKESNFEIVEVLQESKSAKMPDNRPVFSSMIERIQNGEAEGILFWQINRLSRNPVDSGTLQWLLQKGVLKSIRTFEREYRPDDNVLMFSVETGMANQFILDLRKNVKRGLQGKFERGWRPGVVPIGYKHDYDTKTIIIVPEYLDLVRKMWNLLLTGVHTTPKILDIVNNEWGLITPIHGKSGGKPLSKTGIYGIFTNIFYAGIIEFNGEQKIGNHKAIISLEEYDKAQIILGRKGKPRPQKHEFIYNGLIRCTCGYAITGSRHIKKQKNGNIHFYTHYHCSSKKGVGCIHKKHVSEKDLEKQVIEKITKVDIRDEFKQLAQEFLREDNEIKSKEENTIYESQHKALEQSQKELNILIDLRCRELINDEIFKVKKEALEKRILDFREKVNITELKADNWIELCENTFEFITNIVATFKDGDINKKREIINALGSNLILEDKKLIWNLNKWFVPIEKSYKSLEDEYLKLEPLKGNPSLYKKKFDKISTYWSELGYVFRTKYKTDISQMYEDLSLLNRHLYFI